jgi:hypothetical protein
VHNILGIVDWDLVEKDEDGFYPQYNPVLLDTSNNTKKEGRRYRFAAGPLRGGRAPHFW